MIIDDFKLWGCHGTDSTKIEKLTQAQPMEPNRKFLPPDLGFGLYLYVMRRDDVLEPYNNAINYLNRWKPDYKQKVVVKIEANINPDKVLNLDEFENQVIFNDFYEENENKIITELQRLCKNNTYHRGNFDGLIIEMMINEYNINVDAIACETYTQFNHIKDRKRSNIPNGKEICIRNYSTISRKIICCPIN
ncbi:hypothetical protein HMPREF2767_02370 [Nosocomiicoccus sp. HMSC067E10]|nr:hypothetical protein HMPREF2767_02370 [Nosocomiicoccus sp. HMSC067E10]OFO52982.1 hypothetical protein HMPREF3029_01810 [Nosocomiicoccus sp. HMSC059G07]